ncbi:MAG: transcriptional repressor [Planctomycetes bacterium]|nr:transcriptional repressor [Planctomycetota bacterium]
MIGALSRDDDAAFTRLCRENGWRRTTQRRAVFSCLCGNREHPSVEAVWQALRPHLPDLALDSVYRILDEFAAAGILRRLEGTRVIRYDPDTSPHGHFVCGCCGRIYDFSCDGIDRAAGACAAIGHVTAVDITVRGVCGACRSSRRPANHTS